MPHQIGPSSDLQQIMPELEHIRCEREQVLMNADSPLDHFFFPDSGVVSVVAVYADGSIIEMATQSGARGGNGAPARRKKLHRCASRASAAFGKGLELDGESELIPIQAA